MSATTLARAPGEKGNTVDIHRAIQQVVLSIQDAARRAHQASLSEPALWEASTEIQTAAVELQKAALALEAAARDLTSAGDLAIADGAQHMASGRWEEAAACFDRATRSAPESPDPWRHLGDALLQAGRVDAAVRAYRGALAQRPEDVCARHNLAIALLGLDEYSEARALLRSLLMEQCGLGDAARGRFEEGGGAGDAAGVHYASPFKLLDRAEQIEYLVSEGRVDRSFLELARRHRELRDEIVEGGAAAQGQPTPLSAEQLRPFAGYFDRIVHYEDASCAGPALNPALDWKRIEEEYRDTRMLVFDDLLSPEALAAFRRFCMLSTVFFHHSPAGFVGSYLTRGLACPVVYQLVAELRARLPRVLVGRPVNNMWAYRYDAEGSGVKPHNGDGSVTINFYLTPDAANCGPPDRGGMVMYDREHPAQWDWLHVNTYKDDPAIQQRIAEYLKGCKETIVPYKCNRAVLFHSTLFHKTDPFRFRPGFENRRLNVTILFGRRGQESASLAS